MFKSPEITLFLSWQTEKLHRHFDVCTGFIATSFELACTGFAKNLTEVIDYKSIKGFGTDPI
jgi:hypothetical protein